MLNYVVVAASADVGHALGHEVFRALVRRSAALLFLAGPPLVVHGDSAPWPP